MKSLICTLSNPDVVLQLVASPNVVVFFFSPRVLNYACEPGSHGDVHVSL